MKILNKIVAVVAICSMAISYAVTASAAISSATATASATTVKAGDTITVGATWDSMVGASAIMITLKYPSDAFTVDSSNNTSYNFGSPRSPMYYPNYIDSKIIASRYAYIKQNYKEDENANVTNYFPSLSVNAGISTDSAEAEKGIHKVAYMWVDTASETLITETDDALQNKTISTVFSVIDGVKPGKYDIDVEISGSFGKDTVNTTTIKKPAKVTITVEGDTPTPTAKAAVKGNEVNGSQMFSTSEAITMPEGVDDVTVTITNDKVTDKTIEETVGKNKNVLGSGTTKFIPIVSYKIGDTSLKGSIFTIKVTNGENNLGTWTYTVPTE